MCMLCVCVYVWFRCTGTELICEQHDKTVGTCADIAVHRCQQGHVHLSNDNIMIYMPACRSVSACVHSACVCVCVCLSVCLCVCIYVC